MKEEQVNSLQLYREYLTDEIRSLEVDLKFYEVSIEGSKKLSSRLEEQKEVTRIRLDRAKAKLKELDESKDIGLGGLGQAVVGHYDKEVVNNRDDIRSVSREKHDLENLVQRAGNKKGRIKRRINRLNDKLERLKRKENRFSSRQRSIIVAKEKIEGLRNSILDRQEAKVNATNNVIDKIEEKREELGPSIIDGIKDTIYDIREKYYLKKRDVQQNILDMLRGSKISITGGRSVPISSRVVQGFRNRIRNADDLLRAFSSDAEAKETSRAFSPSK